MLVLSRKTSEQIVVPECRLTITVLGITGNRVRLGFSAPPNVSVQRSEVVACHSVDRVQPAAASDAQGLPVPIRVLIADPDRYLLDVYRKHLEWQGVTVTTATNGLECVHRLREAAPDVLVMDPSLPWGSGDGVLALMNEDSDMPRIPVIILTDARDRGVLYRLAPFRVDDFQIKPVSGRRLVERIRAFVPRQPVAVRREVQDKYS